jgi:Cytochrome P460
MMKKLMLAVAILALGVSATVVLAQRQGTNTVSAQGRYLPEYTKEGDLILPKNWRSWVYVGSPLTPDGLNDSKEGFPEYHNVYIEPGSYEIYKKTGEFPDGTIFFKELQRVRKPQQFPDGSRSEPSGRGYFPGEYNGADVTVKDAKRYAPTGSSWGYYNFNHHEPKAPTAKVRPKTECAFCRAYAVSAVEKGVLRHEDHSCRVSRVAGCGCRHWVGAPVIGRRWSDRTASVTPR